MEDTKSLIERYKKELMELGKTARAREPASERDDSAAVQKKPQVIGYVSEESGEFPAVFDRIIAEAVANGDKNNARESENAVELKGPEGYPDIDTPEDKSAFDAGRAPRESESNVRENDNAVVTKNRPEDNMNQGTGETISNFPVSTYSTYEEFEAKNTGGGSLVFMVFTASEALPVAGAAVVVSTRIDGAPHEMFSCVTNQSGETPAKNLPAPSKSLSQDEDNEVQPFSLYDATVSKEGFTKVILRDIPVFDGVRSIQRVAMIPAENDREVQDAE